MSFLPADGRVARIVHSRHGAAGPRLVTSPAEIAVLADGAAYQLEATLDVAQKAVDRVVFELDDGRVIRATVLAGGNFLRVQGDVYRVVADRVAAAWRSMLADFEGAS